MNKHSYLKKISVITDRFPEIPEEGTLYVVDSSLLRSAESECRRLFIPTGFLFVIYRNIHSGDEGFFENVKFVLEGDGEFDPEEFDDDFLENIYRRLHKIPWDIAETDRCILRETCLSDLDSFYEIYSDPEITEFTEDLMERSEEEKYTENYRDLIYEIYGHGIWTVVLKCSGEIIGRAGLDERAGYNTPELGFVIGKKWQKKGYATEVCREILRWAHDNNISEVMSLTEKENISSVKLLEKLGFSLKDSVNIGTQSLLRYVKNTN